MHTYIHAYVRMDDELCDSVAIGLRQRYTMSLCFFYILTESCIREVVDKDTMKKMNHHNDKTKTGIC